MSRIALITGGTGGLGQATSQRLAQAGLRVIVADLDEQKARAVAAELPGQGHLGIALDIASEDSVLAAFDRIEEREGPVAALVNFAGILGPGGGETRPLLADTSLEDWSRVLNVNATGAFLVVREMGRHRTAKPVPHGRIILISSTAAQLGGYQANSAYIASKGAILSLTKAAAREFVGAGVTVNAIAPGPIDTEMLHKARGTVAGDKGFSNLTMLPAGRIGEPAEIAAAAAFLLSEDAAFITGATLDVNGGLRMQ